MKNMAKYCPECGKSIENTTSKFCDNCGAKINEANPEVKTGGQPLTVEFILGLIGGIIGFLAGVMAIMVGFFAPAFSVNYDFFLLSGLGGIIFSIIGIIGAAIVKRKTKIAGYLMIIRAIGGLYCINVFYILSFILLIIAGIMAVRYKE
jgi:hypothetical protein